MPLLSVGSVVAPDDEAADHTGLFAVAAVVHAVGDVIGVPDELGLSS